MVRGVLVAAKHEPEIVGLSVTMAASAARLSDALDEVLGSGHAPRGILVGGVGVTAALSEAPRVIHAPDAREAMHRIEALLGA